MRNPFYIPCRKQYNCFENVVNVKEEPQTTPPEITALLQSAKDIKSLKGERFQDLIDLFDWQVGGASHQTF